METVIFGAVPYLVIAIAVIGTAYRYQSNRFSWSTQSSQLLENKQQFLGSVSWHYAILVVFFGHLIGFLLPGAYGGLKHDNVAVGYTAEAIALGSGILAVIGLLIVINRRLSNPRARAVTQPGDSLLLGALLFQVSLGILSTQSHAPGESWFTSAAAPWLWSIVSLSPDVSFIAPLPTVVKLHLVGAMLVFALIPFTRLVHIFSAWNLVKYQWRAPQLVRWFRREAQKETTQV